MKNTKTLVCQDFQINRKVNELVSVHADFLLRIDPRSTEEISDALARINQLFSSVNGVSLVAGQDKPRCTYCGTLQVKDEVVCGQCGGKL